MVSVDLADPLQRLGVVVVVPRVHGVQPGGEVRHRQVAVVGGHLHTVSLFWCSLARGCPHHGEGHGQREEPDEEHRPQHHGPAAARAPALPPPPAAEGVSEEILDINREIC